MNPLASAACLSPERQSMRYWNKKRTVLLLRLSTGGDGRSMAQVTALV
jgi:hypothetical protein